MRYPDGGGLSDQGRNKRETVRLQAADLFASDIDPAEVARRLRISNNSAYRWRRQWRVGGAAALASKGHGGSGPRLDNAQVARLLAALYEGPAAHGFGKDQDWTLGRVAELIAALFQVDYSLRGVSYLLNRIDFGPQTPTGSGYRPRRGSTYCDG
jgi:putative transposase